MFTKLMKLLIVLSFTIVFNVNSIGRDWRDIGTEEAPANQLLIDSAATGDLKGVQEALDLGANINHEGTHNLDNGSSVTGPAILQAVLGGHLNIVKFLIEEKSVDPNTTNREGYSLFRLAILLKDSLHIAEYLMQNGLNTIHINANYGKVGNIDTTKFLIWNGVPHRQKGHKDLEYAIGQLTTMSVVASFMVLSDKVRFKKTDEEHIKEIKEIAGIKNLLKKFALKVDKFKNKSYKDIVKKVNQEIIRKRNFSQSMLEKHNSLLNLNFLPADVLGIITDYAYLYPESPEEFFKISEKDLNELLDQYIKLFEPKQYAKSDFADQGSDACVIM